MVKIPKAFTKRIPPPPREPGTHTNAEVKEALHARAKLRTIYVIALVVLLLAALGIVSSTAQEYDGYEDNTSTPKMLIIMGTNLSPTSIERAIAANKGPFFRLLGSTYGVRTNIARVAAAGSQTLAKILTGDRTAETISGKTTFLSKLQDKGHSTTVALPNKDTNNILRSEKNVVLTCEDTYQLLQTQIPQYFVDFVSKDLLYFQLDGLDFPSVNAIDSSMKVRSDVNLLDNALGQIAIYLTERTKKVKENWYVMLVGQGENSDETVPFFVFVYSRGELVSLKAPAADASAADVYATVMRWFNIESEKEKFSRALGICSNGINVENCKADN